MNNLKKFIKTFKIIRRLYDAYIASRYFNIKYVKIIKWMLNSNEDTNYTYDLEEKNLEEKREVQFTLRTCILFSGGADLGGSADMLVSSVKEVNMERLESND